MKTHYICLYCNSALDKAHSKYTAFCDYFCKCAYQHEERAQPRLRAMRKSKADRHNCPGCGILTWAVRCYACTIGTPQLRVQAVPKGHTPLDTNRGVTQGRLL
jgi:hypothetical protein